MLKITYDIGYLVFQALNSIILINHMWERNTIMHGPLYNYTTGAEIFQYVSQNDRRDLEKNGCLRQTKTFFW